MRRSGTGLTIDFPHSTGMGGALTHHQYDTFRTNPSLPWIEPAYVTFALDADGKVVGIATDKVRAAFERAGLPYTIELLPWKRAYAAAYQRPDACVYSTARTPERDPLFKWVGPTDSAEWVLMDFFSFIVHVFTPQTRAFYGLERLWGDAERIDVSDEG